MVMEKKDWKRSFAFRLKDGDEMISHFITSSKKTESDTIRELLRFAINEIHRVRKERLLAENLNRLESKLVELMRIQQENHQEVMELLKNYQMTSDIGYKEGKQEENANNSMDSSIDSVIDIFNADDFLG